MMMMPKKEKISSLIVSKLSGAGENLDFIEKGKTKEAEKPSSDLSANEAAMSTFLRAFKREDVKGMAAALKDFIYLCDESEDQMEELFGE